MLLPILVQAEQSLSVKWFVVNSFDNTESSALRVDKRKRKKRTQIEFIISIGIIDFDPNLTDKLKIKIKNLLSDY